MICLDRVSKSYGERSVLRDISFTFDGPGILAVTGANGSGKTTLLRLLAGLETPDSGEIRMPNIDRISYVFQDYRLVPALSALKNIELVLDSANRAEGQKWLHAVGLSEQADVSPSLLSGGMQQRLAIARALAYGGDLLLLDEPFSALDGEWKQRMMETVAQYAASHPVVLVSHNEEEITALGCRIFTLPGTGRRAKT